MGLAALSPQPWEGGSGRELSQPGLESAQAQARLALPPQSRDAPRQVPFLPGPHGLEETESLQVNTDLPSRPDSPQLRGIWGMGACTWRWRCRGSRGSGMDAARGHQVPSVLRKVSMGILRAGGFMGSQKLCSSLLLITIMRIMAIVLIIAWLSGMVTALRESLTEERNILRNRRNSPGPRSLGK